MATKEVTETRILMKSARLSLITQMDEKTYNSFQSLSEKERFEFVYHHAMIEAAKEFRDSFRKFK